MRLLLLLTLCFTTHLLFGQDKKVSYQANDKPLVEVLDELEALFDVRFSYSVDELADQQVSIELVEVSLNEILDELFKDTKISYEQLEGRFISVTSQSSKLTLRLRLVDANTKAPLPFYTARVKGTYKGFVADENGELNAIFKNPERTILELSFVGYEKLDLDLAKLKSDELVTMELPTSINQLQGLTVKEYLTAGIALNDQASEIRIDLQNLEILPGLPERDVLLSTQILAGVSSADESAGGLSIRGSSRDNSFIYWNNIPIYQSAHYFGNISSFIPSAVGSLSLFKNYIPTSYGGASSALLVLESRELDHQKPSLETNLNLTHADLYGAVPFAKGKGELLVAGRRSFNDFIPTPTFDAISNKIFDKNLTEEFQTQEESFEYDSKLVFADLNVVGHYQPNSRNELSFSALRSQSTLDYSSILKFDNVEEERTEQDQSTASTGFNLNWTKRLSDRLSGNISSSFADYRMSYEARSNIELNRPDSADTDSRTNELRNWENKLSFSTELSNNHILDFGYQLNVVDGFLEIKSVSALEENENENIESNGLVNAGFVSYFGKWKSGLQLGGGLRLNHYSELEEFKLDQHIRLNYEITNWLMLKSSAGIYHQYISSVEEVDFIFSNTIEQNWIAASAEENIPVISNRQFVVGALLNTGKWLIDIDLYQKKVFAPISRNFGPTPQDEDGYITGNEIIHGIDFTLKRRWKYYRVWISYAFQDSEVEAIQETFPSGLNIPHQVQLSQTLLYKRWQFSLGYTYRTGLAYTKATGATQIIDADETYYELSYESINSSRLPDYHRLDFSTWYRLNKKTDAKIKGEIGLSFLNLLNTRNLYSRTYDLDETDAGDIVIEQIDRALLGFTPNLSIRLKIL